MSLHHERGPGKWRSVSAAHPCPICGKTDWCSISIDGLLAACRRVDEGATKTKIDKQGAPYHLHRLDGTPGPEHVLLPKPASAEVQRADGDSLHSVYSALLARLLLLPAHRDNLRRRGLTDAEIDRRGYRSLPVTGRARIARELHGRFGDAALSVPGFVVKEKNARKYVTLAGAAGLLIPVRDATGRIVALKIRRDDVDGKMRYCCLSSKNQGGAGPGSPVHVPLGIQTPAKVVRLTEGELKADVALALSGLTTISIAGVGNWRPAMDTLKSLGCNTVRLSLDADAATKTLVARALRDCAAGHAGEGFTVELERWPVEHKGIDDALAAGVVPEVLTGVAAVAAIRAIADAAGVRANVIDRLGQSLADGGSDALFRDRELLRALALVSINDPAEFARCRSLAQRYKVRLRDLEKALAACRIEITQARPPAASAGQYRNVGGQIVREVLTRDGTVGVPLCNFVARIVERIIVDDGAERTIRLAVVGQLVDGTPLARAEINADDFVGMRWPLAQWGTRAVVYAGVGIADHLRAALQLLSGDVPTRTVFAHLGWRQIADKWYYLHAAGAIGPDGSASDISVSPPDALAGYMLPAPPTGNARGAAVGASLSLLDGLAPDRIAFPMLCAVYRAVLGGTDFGLHLAGPTGVFKSEFAAIFQQHFGSGLDARHLPANWASTGNALEGLTFFAKDVMSVVDDFAPTGSTSDVQRMHREADRILRAQGNRSGRQRMRADGTLRPSKPPRGLIVSTGEDIPRGQSLRARLCILEVGPRDVAVSRLTAAQVDAAAGKFAAALAGFICWLSPQYGAVRDRLRTESAELRSFALSSGQHRHARTPDITASLALGLRYLLAYAIEVGAVTKAESAALWARGWAALNDTAAAQAEHVAAAEPTAHFLRLISGVIASGRAHLARPNGCAPDNAAAWGWRYETGGAGPSGVGECQPQGRRIGWIDGESVYLEPEAAYAEAQELARYQGDAIPVGPRILWRRMRERGMLAGIDEVRETNTVRRTLDGLRRDVIYLRAAAVNTRAEPDQPDHSVANADQSGRVGGRLDTDPTTDPSTESIGNGQMVGLVGPETGMDASEGEKSANTVCRYPNHHRRWRSIHGVVLCGICVPPISDKVVAEWLDRPPLDKSGER